MEAISTNHVSSLTVINSQAESQGTIHEPRSQSVANHNSNCSASTNQRTEWFLSTSQWREFIPTNIQDEDQPPTTATNQHADQPANQISGNEEGKESQGDGWSQNAVEDFRSVNQLSDSASIQLTVTPADNHTSHPSNQSGLELRIYEEIQYEGGGPKSPGEDHGNEAGLSTNHSSEPPPLANHQAALDTGDKEEGGKGNDVIKDTKTRQPVYSCVIKKSAANHSAPFLKPRVTVVSTSL